MTTQENLAFYVTIWNVENLFTRNIFSPCLLIPSLKMRIVPIVMVWKMDRMVDNKKNTFNNGGNNRHGLKTLRVNRL